MKKRKPNGDAGPAPDRSSPPPQPIRSRRAAPQPSAQEAVRAECFDCKREYGDENGFPDLIIPLDDWKRISPSGDQYGLLCPSCICKRLSDAGIETTGRFRSGPFVEAVDRAEARLKAVADLVTKFRERAGECIPATANGVNWCADELAAALSDED